MRELGAALRGRCGVGGVGGNGQLNFGAGIEVAPEFEIAANGFGAFTHAANTVMPGAALIGHNL